MLYSCFIGKNGYSQLNRLKKEKEELQIVMIGLQTANRKIQDNVTSLIEDLEAVEHEARQKLGLIQENEVFLRRKSLKPANQKLATNYFGIVAAGGSGARLNSETPKQYLEINKRSILEISVGTLLNSVNFKKLVVVVPKSDMEKCYFLKEKFKQIELVAGVARDVNLFLRG